MTEQIPSPEALLVNLRAAFDWDNVAMKNIQLRAAYDYISRSAVQPAQVVGAVARVDEQEALDWLHKQITFKLTEVEKAKNEIAAFQKRGPNFGCFIKSWQFHHDQSAQQLAVYRTLEGIVADRDEWRIQHENLLSVRQSDLSAIAAMPIVTDEMVERALTAFTRSHRDSCYPDASDGEARIAVRRILSDAIGGSDADRHS